jgi:hypothetical protein
MRLYNFFPGLVASFVFEPLICRIHTVCRQPHTSPTERPRMSRIPTPPPLPKPFGDPVFNSLSLNMFFRRNNLFGTLF